MSTSRPKIKLKIAEVRAIVAQAQAGSYHELSIS
jgi:hypothetical protein